MYIKLRYGVVGAMLATGILGQRFRFCRNTNFVDCKEFTGIQLGGCCKLNTYHQRLAGTMVIHTYD